MARFRRHPVNAASREYIQDMQSNAGDQALDPDQGGTVPEASEAQASTAEPGHTYVFTHG